MNSRRTTNLLCVFFAGMVVLHGVIFWNARDLVRRGYPDFTIFYVAGKVVQQGSGRQLYSEAVQYRVQQEIFAGGRTRQWELPYNHPPFEALLFLPLARVPYTVAYLVWGLINLSVFVAVVVLLRPHVLLLRERPLTFWVLGALAFSPAAMGMVQGQDIFMLLLVFALAYISLSRGADISAGCWLGLGLFRFHLVLPFVLMLLWSRRWKVLAGFVGVGLCLCLLAIGVVGWEGALGYPAFVWGMEDSMTHLRMELPPRMPNIHGLVENVLSTFMTGAARNLLVVVMSVAICLATSFKLWRSMGKPLELSFSLCLIAALLISYHTLMYDLSLLLLPIVLVLNYVRQNGTWATMLPIYILFLSPFQVLLAMRTGRFALMAIAVLIWWWGISRDLSQFSQGAHITQST